MIFMDPVIDSPMYSLIRLSDRFPNSMSTSPESDIFVFKMFNFLVYSILGRAGATAAAEMATAGTPTI
jgi:hypothetical protein